jgi:uncharacterized membrane protein
MSIRTRDVIAVFCLLWIQGAQAAAAEGQLTVEVDKVVYLPGETGTATVVCQASGESADSLRLESFLEYRLTEKIALEPVDLDVTPGQISTNYVPFTAPKNAWGVKLTGRLLSADRELARAWDVFAVGTDNYRLGQVNNHGGDLPKSAARLFDNQHSYWPAKWRKTKGTTLEIMAALPSEFCGFETDWEEWVGMQGGYRGSKAALSAYIEAAHRLGIKVMIYNNATPSGWVGTSWARKHPEWLSYDYMGGMRADLTVKNIEAMKSWRQVMKRTIPSGFEPFYLNFYDPKLTAFGCDQMLSACREYGYDGVRFDGHWILGDVWGGIGYDMQGRRPNRGESLDGVSTRIIHDLKTYTRERKPDFTFGFNYGNNYHCGGARNPNAYRAACADGGMILWEGAVHHGAFSNWRTGALALRENALRVHQLGGIHYGQIFGPSHSKFPNNDFYQRYIYITSFAALSHIYGTVYFEHPGYLPIQGLYYRFALRYGDLLFDKRLRPIQKPADHLSVDVADARREDLWWKPYVYKRQLEGGYQVISHLVNMPGPDVDKKNSSDDKQPAPLEDVRVTFAQRPSRVFMLDPEEEAWMQSLGTVESVTIPELKSWKIIVQEFPGSCVDIPVEVIAQGDHRGKDRAPDPKDGRIVFPITLFLTGATGGDFVSTSGVTGTRLVEDEDTVFGHALFCEAGESREPVQVLSGPNQSMPTASPGRLRITLRLKVSDNTRREIVCTAWRRFGRHAIHADEFREAGAWQEFSYEYELREGLSNYVFMNYHGVADLWIDSVVMQELELARDRKLFDARGLQVDALPTREGASKKAHLVRGLWHDFFGWDAAAARAGIEIKDSWESFSTDHANIADALPVTVSELMEYDLVALLNVSADSLQPVRRKNLREYVLRGGTLFVGGGPHAFGHGGYANTFLEEILPVEIEKFDLARAEGDAQVIVPGAEDEITAGISFADLPRNLYRHRVELKPGATDILKSGAEPILSRWNAGRGTVYAFTGSPCGETADGTAWWAWDGWQEILDRILEGASPGGERTYEAGAGKNHPVLGRLDGTKDLNMITGHGVTVAPLDEEGVQVTPQGVSCGYGKDLDAEGVLLYPGGLIRPHGSITFTITPGWDTKLSDIGQSQLLFSTQSEEHGGIFQVYIYVHSGGDMALGLHVHTNDKGADSLTGHTVYYPILPIRSGGMRGMRNSTWKKGEPHTVTVEWTPYQIALTEDGKAMNSGDFLPGMDLNSFRGPLLIGSDNGRRLSRVKLKDIVIRGGE